MAYKVEFDESEHVDLLMPVLENVLREDADILIVTAGGDTIETHKILLSMFSRSMGSILSIHHPGETGLQGISVPARSKTVRNLLKLLEEGNVLIDEKDDKLGLSCAKLRLSFAKLSYACLPPIYVKSN